MTLPDNALLLRLFVGELDQCGGTSFYEQSVLNPMELNLAGATVTCQVRVMTYRHDRAP